MKNSFQLVLKLSIILIYIIFLSTNVIGQGEVNMGYKIKNYEEFVNIIKHCPVCGKNFKSLDASHRVCDKCRPKWIKKRNELEKAFVNIEDTETFELLNIEELTIFERIE